MKKRIGKKTGEGSRGGNIIGHTRSGKPIYRKKSLHFSKEYTDEDKSDIAKVLHNHISDLHQKNLESRSIISSTMRSEGKDTANTKMHRKSIRERSEEIRNLIGSRTNDEVLQEMSKNKESANIVSQYIDYNNEFQAKKMSIVLGKNLEKSANNFFEKGGKRAVIGERRTFGGREYIKTNDGWRYVGKGKGDKAKQHINSHKESSITHQERLQYPKSMSDKDIIELKNRMDEFRKKVKEQQQTNKHDQVSSEIKTTEVQNKTIQNLTNKVGGLDNDSSKKVVKKKKQDTKSLVKDYIKYQISKDYDVIKSAKKGGKEYVVLESKERVNYNSPEFLELQRLGDEGRVWSVESQGINQIVLNLKEGFFEGVDKINDQKNIKTDNQQEGKKSSKKRAELGEEREFGGRLYVKTESGWKYKGKGSGKEEIDEKDNDVKKDKFTSVDSALWKNRDGVFRDKNGNHCKVSSWYEKNTQIFQVYFVNPGENIAYKPALRTTSEKKVLKLLNEQYNQIPN